MIKRIITYFLIVTSLLYGLRYLHYYGLLKQQKGYYAKYKTAFFEKNNFNVVFLGSSRAEMHYNTFLFDSLTKKNSFNLSLAGATPQVAFAALKAYSKIDGRMPYFYYNPYYSWPYIGFKNLSTSIHGWLNIPNQIDSLYYKGYFKESLRPSLTFVHIEPYNAYFNIHNRNYLDSIITICKLNNTKITLLSSPTFAAGQVDLLNKKQIVLQVNNIAKIHDINYYDLSSLPFCNNRKLFIDHYHLNHLGANKYTTFLANFFNNKIAINSLK